MAMTKAQRELLTVIPDWSAPYEVLERLGLKVAALPKIKRRLDDLVSMGAAYYGPASNTYRASFTGRAALAHQGQPEEPRR